MTKLVDGETAVVTGGSSGMGRAISLTLARHGADVVVTDIRESPRLGGKPTSKKIRDETGATAAFVECDVSQYEDLENAVSKADEFGGIDIMVNNAGIGSKFDESDDYEKPASMEDKYDRIMDVNAKGVFLGCHAAADSMMDNGGGNIVNIVSINADLGFDKSVAYCGSKGAAQSMTYAFGDLFGPDIRVNSINPGAIETAMDSVGGTDEEEYRVQKIPRGRLGDPQDVANAALILSSEFADYITSEALTVDGGWSHTLDYTPNS